MMKCYSCQEALEEDKYTATGLKEKLCRMCKYRKDADRYLQKKDLICLRNQIRRILAKQIDQ